jgi:xanthosine utilization system XapX-like protein
MLGAKIRVEAQVVATVARCCVVIVAVCGLLGLAVGAERVVRAERLTEGLVIAVASTMATAVSLTVLLFIAWRADRAPGTWTDTPVAPGGPRHGP